MKLVRLLAFEEWGLDRDSFEEAHRVAVVEDRIFRVMPPFPDVAEVLWRLSDAGVWIRIITHRLLFNWAHEITAADTAAWLDLHRIPYRDLCFIGDKPTVGADLYVDDSPHNIAALRAAGRRVIVFDQPYNRGVDGARAHSWLELEELIRADLPPAFSTDVGPSPAGTVVPERGPRARLRRPHEVTELPNHG